jgi:SAM-dependent methyltransferase
MRGATPCATCFAGSAASATRGKRSPPARSTRRRRSGARWRRPAWGSSQGAIDDLYESFPDGFFDRADPSGDQYFYGFTRLVTHIDDGAIAAVGALYDELGIDGDVLDLMSSWVSHFRATPRNLTVLGMNREELDANPQAAARVVHDLNASPLLPFPDAAFDAAVCCVSVDYLVHPIEVFRDVARVLRPGAPFVCTFSNRLFPTKAIRGWLSSGDREHLAIVAEYFKRSGAFAEPVAQLRTPLDQPGDPLYAVWAPKTAPEC